MDSEPIGLEEAEATIIGPRDSHASVGSDYLYIRMRSSPKTDQIQQGSLIVFRETLYQVSTKGEIGTPGQPIEFALLKICKPEEEGESRT